MLKHEVAVDVGGLKAVEVAEETQPEEEARVVEFWRERSLIEDPSA